MLIERPCNSLCRERIARTIAIVFVVILHIGACFGALYGLEKCAGSHPQHGNLPLGLHAEVARGRKGYGHRSLDKLEIARGGVARDGEILLEVSDLQLEVAQSVVAHIGILEFDHTVGKVDVEAVERDLKAFIQSYYTRVEAKDYLADDAVSEGEPEQ